MDSYSYIHDNFSAMDLPPSTQHYISGAVYSLISITGIIGNSFVIIAVLSYRNLQTSTNVFIVNLAVADFLTSAVLPFYVVSFWTGSFFPGLDTLCTIATGLARSFIAASAFNLASISINRLLIVIQAKTIYRSLFGPVSITIWVIGLWLLSLLLSFLPHFMGIGRIGYTIRAHQCGLIAANPKSEVAHAILALGTYPLPFTIIIICYSWIFLHVRRHNIQMAKYRSGPQSTVSAISTKRSSIKRKDGVSSKQLQITKSLFYILCAFVVCLSPQMVCSIVGCVNIYTKTIVTLNSIINPFIYGINHPQFRRIFITVFCRVHADHSMNSTSINTRTPPDTAALSTSRSCILQDTAL